MKRINKAILLLSLIIASYSWSINSELSYFFQTEENQIQNASFDEHTTFDVLSDGYVKLNLTLSHPLTDTELDEVETLSSDNKDQLNITVDIKDVDISLNGSLNTSAVWSKIFKTLAIDKYSFANQKYQSIEAFFKHYNL